MGHGKDTVDVELLGPDHEKQNGRSWALGHKSHELSSCMSCSSPGRSPLGKVLRTAKARNSTNTAAAAGTALMKTLSAGGRVGLCFLALGWRNW